MSGFGLILFVVVAVFALMTAITTVATRNPLRAAMSLLVHIGTLAILFLMLDAQMLATIQLLVYAGAVVVLFVFVIMLIGPSATAPDSGRGTMPRALSLSLLVMFMAVMAFSVMKDPRTWVPLPVCPDGDAKCAPYGSVENIGRTLFSMGPEVRSAVIPFELVSILLTVAIVGAIAVARGRSKEEIEEGNRIRRMREPLEAQNRAEEDRLAREAAAHGGH